MAIKSVKLSMGLMVTGLVIIIAFLIFSRFYLAGAGLALYAAGFYIYCWQKGVRRKDYMERVRPAMLQDQYADLPGYTSSLREHSRRRQLRQLKFLGLLAVLLFPFYEKLIEMLMEALVFGHGNIRSILGIMALAFCVAFVVGTGGLVIEDLLEQRAGRENYGDLADALDELSYLGKAIPVEGGTKSL